jgi:hypothetical protein
VGTLAFSGYTIRRQVDRERAADDDKRRISARRVNLRLVAETHSEVVEVVNGGDDSIYLVGVYTQGKSSGQYLASSGNRFQDLILPGAKHQFGLTPRKLAAPIDDERGKYIVAQFSDSNGYCWNRYMMGRIEVVNPELRPGPWADDEARSMSAKAVALTLVRGEPNDVVEVVNGGDDSIYLVGLYTQGKSSGQYLASSGESFIDRMLPGAKHRFTLTPKNLGIAIQTEDKTIVARFSDSNGYRWDRYMLGRIDAADPNIRSGPWAES